jgi:adenylate cyclase
VQVSWYPFAEEERTVLRASEDAVQDVIVTGEISEAKQRSHALSARHLSRRLVSVCFADVVGWTSLVEEDEHRVSEQWVSLRRDVIEPLAVEWNGEIQELQGDAVVVLFSSVVQALQWAMAIQKQCVAIDRESELRKGLKLRIAVGADDCLIDQGKAVGDGVNVTARILQEATPNEIVTTELVRALCLNKVSASFRDLGEHQLKNVSRLVRVFAVEQTSNDLTLPSSQPFLSWHSRPTVAVLPFKTVGDDQSAYFAEGICEELIVGIAKIRSILVTARSSTLRYRQNRPDNAAIGRELGVRYIIDGSVRRYAESLRLNVELVDNTSQRVLWSGNYDGNIQEIFDFEDRIIRSVVPVIEPRVFANESRRALRQPTQNLSAYDALLRARAKMFSFDRADFEECGRLLLWANEQDPQLAQAFSHLAWWHSLRVAEGHSENHDVDRQASLARARRAVQIDPDDAFAHAVLGHVSALVAKDFDSALMHFALAVDIDKCSAFAWGVSASTLCFVDRPNDAENNLKNAYVLSPFDRMNFFFFTANAIAEFVRERYPEAAAWSRRAIAENYRFVAAHRILASSLGLCGQELEARAAAHRLLEISPGFRIREFIAWYPLQNTTSMQQLERGMRSAGLPE